MYVCQFDALYRHLTFHSTNKIATVIRVFVILNVIQFHCRVSSLHQMITSSTIHNVVHPGWIIQLSILKFSVGGKMRWRNFSIREVIGDV